MNKFLLADAHIKDQKTNGQKKQCKMEVLCPDFGFPTKSMKYSGGLSQQKPYRWFSGGCGLYICLCKPLYLSMACKQHLKPTAWITPILD